MQRSPHRSARRRAGFTVLELCVSLTVLAVGMSVFASTVVSVTAERAIVRESVVAATAADDLLEQLRASDFETVFARYNADPDDDPTGPGTAPGNVFAVDGLQPLPGAGAVVGEVLFPAVDVSDPADPPSFALREDVVLPELDMPRDLNGDSIVDDLDHTGDYRLLPVQVVLRWQGRSGDRELRRSTILSVSRWQ